MKPFAQYIPTFQPRMTRSQRGAVIFDLARLWNEFFINGGPGHLEVPDAYYTMVSKDWLLNICLPAFQRYACDKFDVVKFSDLHQQDTYDCNAIGVALYDFVRSCHRLSWSYYYGAAPAIGWGYTVHNREFPPLPVNHAIGIAFLHYNGGYQLCAFEPQCTGDEAFYGALSCAALRFAHF